MLSLKSPAEIAQEIAAKVRSQRLALGWTQAELAERAGLSTATYVLFERSGRISLLRLLRVFATLGLQPDIQSLASRVTPAPSTIDALTAPRRVRGRRRRS